MPGPEFGRVFECAVAVLVGVAEMLVGFRVIGPSRGATPAADRWHARYGKFCKVCGLIIVLCGVGVYLISLARAPKPNVETPNVEPWNRYTTADGVCSIEFPQQPAHKVDRDAGTDTLEVEPAGNDARFSLTFSDLSPKDATLTADQLFELLRVKFSSTQSGTVARLVRDLPADERGFPGREYQFAVGDRFVSRIKAFVNGRRVYLAVAVNPPNPRLDSDAQRFIDSFRFEIAKP